MPFRFLFVASFFTRVKPRSTLFSLCLSSVEAPHDLDITDPGYLGLLLVKWSAPYGALMDPACRVRFYLTYFNTFLNRWSVSGLFSTNPSPKSTVQQSYRYQQYGK